MTLFRSRPMQFMSLYLLKEDVSDAAVILAQSQSFDLANANAPQELLTERYEQDYAIEFEQALGRYKKIVSFLDIGLTSRVKKISHVSYEHLQQSNTRLGVIWEQCTRFEVRRRKIDEQKRMLSNLQAIWKIMAEFGMDLGVLEGQLDFLDIRLGIIPSSHMTRLKHSMALEGYYLTDYAHTGENTHVIVAGMLENKKKVQALLNAASFQKINIPPELQGQPEKVTAKIAALEDHYHAEYLHFKQNMEIFCNKNIELIRQLGDTLALAKPYMLLSQKMQGVGALVNVNGWVLHSQAEQIKQQLHNALGEKVVISIRDPEPEEYSITPSDIKHNALIKPFINLIRHYGIPRYNELDPSWFFTLSYVLMFGIMFGDIGHGLCFIIIAALVRKKWSEFSAFLLLIGLSSILFGFLYGSIFCYEHVIDALWIAPLSDPVLMLKVAFWWGFSFIVLLNLFSIYNRVSAQQIRHALMDGQGVSGLLLYLAMIWLGYQFISDAYQNSYWLLVLLPLILIGINKWFNSQATHVERLLVIIIESYELMINYLSNTISFLRLAAFSLNHVALAMTVLTLADMLEGSSYWGAIVFGNLFILILEGAVVAIQTLRLEYYESFSRFYYADGYQFEPLSLSPRKLL